MYIKSGDLIRPAGMPSGDGFAVGLLFKEDFGTTKKILVTEVFLVLSVEDRGRAVVLASDGGLWVLVLSYFKKCNVQP